MKTLLRLVLTIPLFALTGFCLFGFIATFDQGPSIIAWTGRAAYCGIPALCVWAIVRLWHPKRPTPPGPTAPGQKLQAPTPARQAAQASELGA